MVGWKLFVAVCQLCIVYKCWVRDESVRVVITAALDEVISVCVTSSE